MKEIGAGMPFDGKRMIYGGFAALIDDGARTKPGYVDGYLVPVPNDKNEPKKDTSKRSMTGLIPSGLGVILLVAVGIAIYRPGGRKNAMHAAAVVGAGAVLGGLYALFGGLGEWGKWGGWSGPSLTEKWAEVSGKPDAKVSAWDQPKVRSGALTAVVGAIYVALAVKSFIDARKRRANA